MGLNLIKFLLFQIIPYLNQSNTQKSIIKAIILVQIIDFLIIKKSELTAVPPPPPYDFTA